MLANWALTYIHAPQALDYHRQAGTKKQMIAFVWQVLDLHPPCVCNGPHHHKLIATDERGKASLVLGDL